MCGIFNNQNDKITIWKNSLPTQKFKNLFFWFYIIVNWLLSPPGFFKQTAFEIKKNSKVVWCFAVAKKIKKRNENYSTNNKMKNYFFWINNYTCCKKRDNTAHKTLRQLQNVVFLKKANELNHDWIMNKNEKDFSCFNEGLLIKKTTAFQSFFGVPTGNRTHN